MKTTMNVTAPTEVANTILLQMGGQRRIAAMTGAGHFRDHGDGVSFRFPNRVRSKPNYVLVRLAPNDTYTVVFGRISDFDLKNRKEYNGLYFDSLVEVFERETGLYLSL